MTFYVFEVCTRFLEHRPRVRTTVALCLCVSVVDRGGTRRRFCRRVVGTALSNSDVHTFHRRAVEPRDQAHLRLDVPALGHAHRGARSVRLRARCAGHDEGAADDPATHRQQGSVFAHPARPVS